MLALTLKRACVTVGSVALAIGAWSLQPATTTQDRPLHPLEWRLLSAGPSGEKGERLYIAWEPAAGACLAMTAQMNGGAGPALTVLPPATCLGHTPAVAARNGEGR